MTGFTQEELLIIDVAVNEFIWSLDDELQSWETVNFDGFFQEENEWDTIHEMLLDAENVSDRLQEMLEEEANHHV